MRVPAAQKEYARCAHPQRSRTKDWLFATGRPDCPRPPLCRSFGAQGPGLPCGSGHLKGCSAKSPQPRFCTEHKTTFKHCPRMVRPARLTRHLSRPTQDERGMRAFGAPHASRLSLKRTEAAWRSDPANKACSGQTTRDRTRHKYQPPFPRTARILPAPDRSP